MSGSSPDRDQEYEFRPFRVPKYRIEFERARRLDDIPQVIWYTPAALYLWGRYSEVQLADLVRRTDVKIFWRQFDKAIFRGFGRRDSGWNHVLWAAKQEDWQKIMDGILESVQIDIPGQRIYQYALQELQIPDPLFADNGGLVTATSPRVMVQAFAVLTNREQLAFPAELDTLRGLPGMQTFRPSRLHAQAADRLFSLGQLTTEKAFHEYGRVLRQLEDAEFQQKVDHLKNKREQS